ncbi:tail fiber assembly protein, partial [Serratia fonticola]
SATTAAFYPIAMLELYEQAGTLPADLVDVTDEDYQTFIGPPPAGKMRGSKDKNPAWVDMPAPTAEEVRQRRATQQARLLNDAYAAMKPLELAVKLGMATDEEKARLDAWERYTVLLNRVDIDKPAWPDRPNME